MRTQNTPWLSPVGTCPFCTRDLVKLEQFVDGRPSRGPWATMCVPCHKIHGVGLGQGKGQHFKLNEEDSKFYQS